MMNWYKIDKTARGSGGRPLIDDPTDSKKKSKPGDQNGGDGVSYKATHGLGDSGYAGHRFTDDRNPGEVGYNDDDLHEDSVSPFGTSHDYGEGTGPADGKGGSDQGSKHWFDENDPNGPVQFMLNNLPGSDNLDKHPSMLSNMNGASHSEVFDEIREKRRK